jgi:hypothetical protein
VAALLREELRVRLRGDPGARGWIEVREGDKVPFRDVLLVLKAFNEVGLPQKWIARDAQAPAGGTARTLRLVRAAPAAPRTPPPAPPVVERPPAPPGPEPAAGPEVPPAAPDEAGAVPTTAPLAYRLDRGQPRKSGSTARSDQAVEAALRWLASHQSEDGRWEAAGFHAWCDGKPSTGEKPDGPGRAVYDVGVTGLALSAFLTAGYAPRGEHAYAGVLRRGLTWLRGQQDPEGCFGPRSTQHYIYNHGTAAIAMLEAYGLTESPFWHVCAQKGLDFLLLARNPYFVWRYGVKPGDNDTSVTSWMMTALELGRRINAHALARGRAAPFTFRRDDRNEDDEAFDGIKAWILKMTDPDYGRVGYLQRGQGPARTVENVRRFPPQASESMTAVSLLARVFLQEDPKTSDIIHKGADLCSKLPPSWNRSDGSIDMYYWYYGSLAMYQLGGAHWEGWRRALDSQVVSNQRLDGTSCSFKGSWDPVDPWSPEAGRVYSTALCALSLAAPNRFARVPFPK